MLIIKDQKQQSFSTDVDKVYLVHIRGVSYGDCIRLYVISKTNPMGSSKSKRYCKASDNHDPYKLA